MSTSRRATQIVIAVVAACVAYFALAFGSGLWRNFGEPSATLTGIVLCVVTTAGLIATAAKSPVVGAVAGLVILILAVVAITAGWGNSLGGRPSLIDLRAVYLLGGISPATWTGGVAGLMVARFAQPAGARVDGQRNDSSTR